jgi:hypothetical protein
LHAGVSTGLWVGVDWKGMSSSLRPGDLRLFLAWAQRQLALHSVCLWLGRHATHARAGDRRWKGEDLLLGLGESKLFSLELSSVWGNCEVKYNLGIALWLGRRATRAWARDRHQNQGLEARAGRP